MKRILCLALMLLVLTAAAPAFAQDETATQAAEIELSVADGLDSSWENIMLVGADTRDNLLEEGRADTTMVLSVNRETGAIRLLSLARDMWVRLPTGSENRINTAYRFGGPELAMQTVNQTLGLNITKYAAINFYGFCDVIDALGGIEIEVTRAEAQVINASSADYGSEQGEYIPGEGKAVLTGAQALAYARIRKLDNDFGRTKRQRNVLFAILNKVMTLSLSQQLAFVRECLSCVSTNVGLADIITLGMAVLAGGMEDMKELGLPTDFEYRTQKGMSTIVFDAEATRNEAHAFIYGE